MSEAPILLNLGSGRRGARLPAYFDAWRQLRIDCDPEVEPDLVANITDLSAIAAESADAVWSSHCIEHLFRHEIGLALAEMQRVLKNDGFACILVPDLQAIARFVVADRLDEIMYVSPAGPVTAHDALYGFGPALERGKVQMAHRSGFTPGAMTHQLRQAKFANFVVRRRPSLELAAVARKTPWSDRGEYEALLRQLDL